MVNFKEQSKKELLETIIPFWNNLIDEENGGFYGFMTNDLVVDKTADKGVILNSRIMWFYSAAYKALGDDASLKKYATHAYNFLREKCYDKENGGVYWHISYDGAVADSMKHTYNQAFAVYGLATYYLSFGDKSALDLACEIFETIEEKCTDDVAYQEAFSKDWELIQNDALSENGLIADKTMNTILHLIEAYTVLYKACGCEKVKARLEFLLEITEKYVFDSENDKLFVFFDKNLGLVGDIHSYGHDIEATWLVDRACEVLGDAALIEKWKNINLRISANIKKLAFVGGALNNERDKDEIDNRRVWWVQAEAVVGFVNAYMNSGDAEFLETADTIFNYIQTTQKDTRENSEWWGEVDFDGKPMDTVEMVNPWKCPYHNGRMCVELIEREF